MLILLWVSGSVPAQDPKRFSYQAVLRDIGNQPLANRAIRVRVSILSDSINGTTAYSESHTPTTSALGVVQLTLEGGI